MRSLAPHISSPDGDWNHGGGRAVGRGVEIDRLRGEELVVGHHPHAEHQVEHHGVRKHGGDLERKSGVEPAARRCLWH